MKILHTGDWHIGSPRSPYKDGVNLRSEDTKRCLDELLRVATEEHPDYTLVSGDIFDAGKVWSDRCCTEIVTASYYIQSLAHYSKNVIVLRGTENHDGESQFNVLKEMFAGTNVIIATEPGVLKFTDVNIAVLPGFSPGIFAIDHPDLSKEERNTVITDMLSDMAMGMKAQCDDDKPAILMAHFTVPGADVNAGQTSMLAQFEPMLDPVRLQSAGFDLVALGHIHRPQEVKGIPHCFYCGGINTGNFNDEKQDRGFWMHSLTQFGLSSDFHVTPYRRFKTLELDGDDIAQINLGNIDAVKEKRWPGDTVTDKIVRVWYKCDEAQNKAFNRAALSQQFLNDGAFMVWEILPTEISEYVNRTELGSATDPVSNLVQYLREKEVDEADIDILVRKAEPIIAEAQATVTKAAYTGTFEPVEIYVRNYRNYVEETFDFTDISFCTINGQNGAGKSSLFMDAILDCLYEEPREGDKTGWIRNDESAHSAAIRFTFRIGDKTFRVSRTRAKSGKGTLNIAELVDGEWADRSAPKYVDTQKKIQDIIGMDSTTFKSCALIMQDQYGIFLQAMPEERVRVLSTLLGLDIYKLMEKSAADTARECGGEKNKYNSMIEVAKDQIASLQGSTDLNESLKTIKGKLEDQEQELSECQKKRDEKIAVIAKMEADRDRIKKLNDNYDALSQRKAGLVVSISEQENVISESKKMISEEPEILEGANRYQALKEREAQLLAQATPDKLLEKEKELNRIRNRLGEAEKLIDRYQNNIGSLESLKVRIRAQLNHREADIRQRAADFERFSKLASDMKAKQTDYLTAQNEAEQCKYKLDAWDKQYNAQVNQYDKRLEDLRHRTDLLNNSGCMDSGRAQCRFLADAKAAEAEIPKAEQDKKEYIKSSYDEYLRLRNEHEEAEKKVLAVGYDPDMLIEYQGALTELASVPDDLEWLKEQQDLLSSAENQINNNQALLAQEKERLSELTPEEERADREYSELESANFELQRVRGGLLDNIKYFEAEKQLLVYKERLTTAETRLAELKGEQEATGKQLESVLIEIVKAKDACSDGLEVEKGKLAEINADIKEYDESIASLRRYAGSVESKIEQIASLRKDISGYREKKNEAAKKTAYYDQLKTAFSQGGIPHQIIRSIIPQLTATANSIIGQMTGGKMGVEFRLERYTKNLRERASLDIFIEEGANAPLPYLSKSGGEKVKASLSVILSLAEIKSSSVGVQLGMLFIDEPPFLDGDGIQAYCDALETIQNRYPDLKIMAITHDPTMKARFPQNIDVVKTDAGSKVVY